MLSERRNHGRIRINPFVWLSSLSVRFPADENGEHTHEQHINGNGNDSWNNSYGEMVTLPDKGGTQGRKGYACKSAGWTEGANIVYTGSAGGGKPHNTMQPYQAVYIFMRTA